MSKKNDLKERYLSDLPNQILEHYAIILPIFLAILMAFCYTDVHIRQLPELIIVRIPTMVFIAALIFVKFSRFKNHSSLVIVLNSLACMSIVLMGFIFLAITFHTDLFKSSILAVIVFSFVAYFGVKGFKSIAFTFFTPLLFLVPYIIIVLKPEINQLQELMNPLSIYIAIVILSFKGEQSRFNEFFYKESLIEEKERTEKLYIATVKQNDALQSHQEEILKINKQLENRKEELQINLEVILDLNKQLKYKNKSITASINYARRIQEAILPTDKKLSKVFDDYFVLYKPCEIVSGDFYWMHSSEHYEIIAAVDCTGHGVPGGFMSMLGYSMLNDVVQNNNQLKANEILNRLKEKLKESLNQNAETADQADGLDIALCLINREKKQIEFSGAYMPLTILRNNRLMHIKGDRMPIGRFVREIPTFTNHEITIEENDRFYLYSDGYQDQIGGVENKRFFSKNLKKQLLEIGDKPFNEQKQILDRNINDWKGKNQQMDDILVIGFKLK